MRLFQIRILMITLIILGQSITTPLKAEDPVKRIGVYVIPYYVSARSQDEKPTISVHKELNGVLSSDNQEHILIAKKYIESYPEMITPMTLMVLAIRLYDVGLRDESVFWYYVAKNRHATLAATLDMSSPQLAGAQVAIRDFVTLTDAVFNGYAFCDFKKQHETYIRSIDWVEKNPYKAIFWDQLPAKEGGRQENLQRAIAKMRATAIEESKYFADPNNLETFMNERKKRGAEAKYCW